MLQEVDLGLFEPELLSSLIAPIISGAPLLSLPFLKSSPALTVEVMLLSSVAPPPQPQSWCLQFLFAWFKNKSKSRRIICDSFRGWLNLRSGNGMRIKVFIFVWKKELLWDQVERRKKDRAQERLLGPDTRVVCNFYLVWLWVLIWILWFLNTY